MYVQGELFTIAVIRPPEGFPKDAPVFVLIADWQGHTVSMTIDERSAYLYELADWLESTAEEREGYDGKQTK